MSRPIVGKIAPEAFERIFRGRFGAPNERVLVGPRTGVDAAVIDLGEGRAMVVAEDPIFPAAGLPLDTFGWFTMHIGASDVAVMGVRPELATYSLLLPPETPEDDLRTIVTSIHAAAAELGIAIVGGHTGTYPVVTAPIVGGITVMGFGAREEIVTPAGARPGDAVLLSKGPAIEAAGLLAVLYEGRLREAVGDVLTDRALARCREITVVEDALLAHEAGAVTAMHDATEGGVRGGLWEIGNASGVGLEVDAAAMPWPEDVQAVCDLLGIDPLAAIAEGTLLVTVAEDHADAVLAAWRQAGIPGARIGTVLAEASRRVLRTREGQLEDLAVPREDPFWPAFFRGVEALGG